MLWFRSLVEQKAGEIENGQSSFQQQLTVQISSPDLFDQVSLMMVYLPISMTVGIPLTTLPFNHLTPTRREVDLQSVSKVITMQSQCWNLVSMTREGERHTTEAIHESTSQDVVWVWIELKRFENLQIHA